MNRTQEERNVYEKAKELHYPNTGMSDLDSFRHELRNAYAKGWLECKQQMMKDAVDGLYIHRNRYTKKNVLHGFDVTCDAIQQFKKGDKVKLIIIKED